MGLPSVAGLVHSLLGSADPKPVAGSNKSGLSIAWLDDGNESQSLSFDVVSSETHEALMTLTDHPVEAGTNVVDNARELPKSMTIEGFISSKPLGSNPGASLTLQSFDLDIPKKDIQPSLTSAIGAITDLISPGPSAATALRASGDYPNRIKDTLEILSKLEVDRTLVSVVSNVTQADSMMITRLSVSRALSDGTGATFHIELRKVRLVSALSVAAPDAAENRGKVAVAKGSAHAKEAPAGKKAVADSVLYSGLH